MTMKNRRLKIIATAAVALFGLGFVAVQSFGDVEYYQMVHKVVENPEPWIAKKTMKIHGFVAPGSIKTEVVAQQTHRSFRLENEGKEIWVRHTGPVPDTFKDQAETVVTGHLALEADGKLWVTAIDGDAGISAKCPSKYNGDKR
jgi:cytochrome c-type biogenesis protein CcmE